MTNHKGFTITHISFDTYHIYKGRMFVSVAFGQEEARSIIDEMVANPPGWLRPAVGQSVEGPLVFAVAA